MKTYELQKGLNARTLITNYMVNIATTLKLIGVLLIIGAIALIIIDLSGVGDTSGLDYKDVGILIVGLIILIIGFLTKPKASEPATQPSVQST